jgi:GalNAc-alpha-(1->4)-GalNAc-alpha-(1->3)-diNAcBac-PP-undecaprenol alpha-1,4-N-acetyl-D-galactosaminyltransferase
MQKIKIAFILNSLSGGGIESVVTTYANELVKDDRFDINLILLHKKDHFFIVDNRINIIENDASRDISSKLKYTVRTIFFLRNALKTIQNDRVIVNGEWINTFTFLSTIGIKKRIYLADHSNPVRPKQTPFKIFDKFAYKNADGVLVLSEAAKSKVYTKYKQRNIIVLDNPVKLIKIDKSIEKENIIIAVGRLSKEKGQDVLLKAFSLLTNRTWQLYFLGEGEFRANLEALAMTLKIESRIHFLGNRLDLDFYFSKAKIFVMPSHTENFPIALIEAMSAGLACIITDCIYWRGEDQFIISRINGLKVPVNDPNSMAKAIDEVIESEELRLELGNEALKIRERFAKDRIVLAFQKAIDI